MNSWKQIESFINSEDRSSLFEFIIANFILLNLIIIFGSPKDELFTRIIIGSSIYLIWVLLILMYSYRLASVITLTVLTSAALIPNFPYGYSETTKTFPYEVQIEKDDDAKICKDNVCELNTNILKFDTEQLKILEKDISKYYSNAASNIGSVSLPSARVWICLTMSSYYYNSNDEKKYIQNTGPLAIIVTLGDEHQGIFLSHECSFNGMMIKQISNITNNIPGLYRDICGEDSTEEFCSHKFFAEISVKSELINRPFSDITIYLLSLAFVSAFINLVIKPTTKYVLYGLDLEKANIKSKKKK